MSEKSGEALQKAMEMEVEGRQFYKKSFERAKNPLVKRVFEELVKDEDHHIEWIRKIHDEMKDKPLSEWVRSVAPKSELESIFTTVAMEKIKLSRDDVQALHVALRLEEKSTKYYETLASGAENPFEQRFFLTLSYEERGHYLHILDSIEYLSDPSGWHYRKEHDMVDGG